MDTTTNLAEKATVERFNASQDRIARDFGYGETAGALGITKEYIRPLSIYIEDQLKKISEVCGNRPEKAFLQIVVKLHPELISLATLSGLLHSIAIGAPLRVTNGIIGKLIEDELWADGFLTADPSLAERVDRAVRKRHGSLRYRKQAARSIAARAGFRNDKWSRRERIIAGNCMLRWALDCLPEVFQLEKYVNEDGEITYFPQVTPGALELAEACVEEAIKRHPVLLPCTEPPRPWQGCMDGGYWSPTSRLRAPLVRVGDKVRKAAVKAALASGAMKPHVDGIDALQSVPWVINTRVLEVIKWCYANNIVVPGLPSKADVAEPAKLSPEEWEQDDKRRLQRHRISQVKEHNRGLRSNRVLFAQDVATAERLASGRFYTPCNTDWRGRVYPIPHFNFQRDDRVRALFLFADGLPIGTEGLYWLKVHVANCGDFDKISKRPFEERVKWTTENARRIQEIAQSPLSSASLQWWTKADKPFLFLAACLELSQALEAGPAFVTTLPVSFDGSCSGLQHLCAMTRAPEGALVNLTPQEIPQDVYQTVADLVQERVTADAEGYGPNVALAKRCLAHGITRKLVKRNVMTYSYSSKKFGMMQQHMEDLMRPLEIEVLEGKHQGHPFGDTAKECARYLAGHVYDAIETVIHKPAEAMGFLQKIARALAHEGKAATWTTPTGLPWSNRYFEYNTSRVSLWLMDTRIQLTLAEGDTATVRKDKSANGIAPNFVHALDAAHLLLTVNACASEGIVSIATVHDSFGCLAPQAMRFNQIIREQFVQMYEEHDVLHEVLECAKRDLTPHNWQRLPEVPVYGSLDLKEVLNAQFAFA